MKTKEYRGIYVGKDPIPVDMNIVDQVREVEEVDPDAAKRYVTSNRHNSTTTIYYLLLKVYLRKGNQSIADLKKYNPNDFIKPPAELQSGKFSLISQHRSSSQASTDKNTR